MRIDADPDAIPEALLAHLRRFAADPHPETALLYCARAFRDFRAFLGLVELVEDLRDALGADVVVASFHPDYRFAQVDDPLVHAIHQSPVPVIHLLRGSSIARARERYPEVDLIPERNRERAVSLGASFFAYYRAADGSRGR